MLIDLLNEASRLAFIISHESTDARLVVELTAKRVELLRQAEKCSNARKPSYEPMYRPYPPLEYIDLQAEHNKRFTIARTKVMQLRMTNNVHFKYA